MTKGGQKNRHIFEKPKKTSLKVKVKKLARKKAHKTHKGGGARTKVEGKKKALRSAGKAALRPKEAILERKKINEFEGRILEEKIERSKELIMWSGVIFFMLLITFLWIYNIRHTFEASRLESDSESGIKSWQEMTNDLEERISDFKDSYEDIKQIKEEESGKLSGLPESDESEPGSFFSTSTTDIATGTITDIKVSEDEIEELKKKLEAGQ